jgi:hypothetical protein
LLEFSWWVEWKRFLTWLQLLLRLARELTVLLARRLIGLEYNSKGRRRLRQWLLLTTNIWVIGDATRIDRITRSLGRTIVPERLTKK